MNHKKTQTKIYLSIITVLTISLCISILYDQKNKLTPIDIPYSYWKNAEKVYLNNQPLKDANPDTFEILYYEGFGGAPPEYARDDKHVYYKGKLIQGADAKSFEALLRGCAVDKNSGYLKGEKIEGSDPQTFECLGGIDPGDDMFNDVQD